MRRVIITAFVVMLASAAFAKDDRDAVPAATPIGKPTSCLRLSDISETHFYGDQVIDFVVFGGKVYRNTLPYACPSLGFEQRYLHKSYGGDICSLDLITVLQSPGLSHGATCGLGEFQQVQLEKVAKK
jgi:hypothetical protein